MSYQFIVITASKERNDIMISLFKELDIQDNLIYYLQASTPENSEEYFIDSSFIEHDKKKVICCAKSHFRAIEYAARDDSSEYSIVVEDDAAFHKTNFLNIIEEIINNWQKHFNHCHYISLGWIPCNNYHNYKLKNSKKIESIANINNKFVFLNDFYNCGTQCYIVKKNKLKEIVNVLNKPTFILFKESIRNFMDSKYGKDFKQFSFESVDFLLNRMMSYEIIFPQLVIEQKNIKSLLGHENVKDYWIRFFTGYEEEMKNYMTY
jgi:GR25 family glycosyltransferase involved in LPS biosynthesis